MTRKRIGRARGTGGLRREANGKWTMRFMGADGRERKRSTGTTDRRDAEAILAQALQREARVRQGLEAPGAQRMADQLARPLREHLAEYLEAFERQEARTAGTMRVRRSILGTFIRLSRAILRRDPTLRDLDSELIERVMHRRIEEGRSARTANTQRQYILAFAAWATDDGRGDFSRLGRMAKRRKEDLDRRRARRALTEAEEEALLGAAGPRRLIYRLALETGLRKGEIRSLAWTDLDLERGIGTVRNTKAGKSDEFNILPDLAEELRAARPMLVGVAARRVFDQVPTHRTFRRDLERAGVAERDARGRVIDFHALRGTLGTRLAAAGVAPQVAKGIMRHSDYRTTVKHYHHLTLHDQRQALETALERAPHLVAEGTSGGVLTVVGNGTSRGTSRRAMSVNSAQLGARTEDNGPLAAGAQTLSLRDFVRALARRCEIVLQSRPAGTIGAVDKRPPAQVPLSQHVTEDDSAEVRLAVRLRALIAEVD
jgi:integrase